MKQTALYEKHRELGAKMVPYAGFDMPVYYSGIVEEHLAVRKNAGLFDISHMGEFFISGDKAESLLQHITANDVSQLKPGMVQYSYLPNDSGGIVDDLVIYKIDENEFMLVVNAANIQKDKDWILAQNESFGADFEDASDDYSLLALQGPESTNILKSLTNIDVETLKFYTFAKGEFNDIKGVIISATGYTGSRGFEIYCLNNHAPKVWDALMKAGKAYGIKPCGLGARDTLRLEAGLLLYGNDMNDQTNPYSVRLGWVTKPEKPFIGRDVILKEKEEGIQERIAGLETTEKMVPRQGYPVLDEEGNEVGIITSGTRSPLLDKGIAMARIKKSLTKPGTRLFVQVRKKQIETKVVKLPFYKG